MNYKYIINPINNKKTKLSSQSGKNIIKKYLAHSEMLSQQGGNKSPCYKLKKFKTPKCEDEPVCDWIKGKGCYHKNNLPVKNPLPVIKKTQGSVKHSLPIIKKIVGPIELSYWEITCPNKTKKKILFLGEEHTVVTKNCEDIKDTYCYDIDDVLELLITSANKKKQCIDIFVENAPKRLSAPIYLKGGKLKKNSEVMDHIQYTYRNCSEHSRYNDYVVDECQNKNLRYHNLDLRRSLRNMRKSRRNKLDSLLFYTRGSDSYNHERDYNLLADYILGVTIKKKQKPHLISILTSMIRSKKKQLHKDTPILLKTYTVKQIMSEMNSFRRIIRKEYKKFMTTKDKYLPDLDLRELVKKTISDNFIAEGRDFTEYTHLFTDFYVLSRLFMEFKTNKDKVSRTPSNCPIIQDGEKTINIAPNRIILLAGADHIKIYNTVISKYFPQAKLYMTDYNKQKILKSNRVRPKITSFTTLFDNFLN